MNDETDPEGHWPRRDIAIFDEVTEALLYIMAFVLGGMILFTLTQVVDFSPEIQEPGAQAITLKDKVLGGLMLILAIISLYFSVVKPIFQLRTVGPFSDQYASSFMRLAKTMISTALGGGIVMAVAGSAIAMGEQTVGDIRGLRMVINLASISFVLVLGQMLLRRARRSARARFDQPVPQWTNIDAVRKALRAKHRQ